LYEADKNLDLHKSQENHYVTECYQKFLGEIGGRKAHHLLHTEYKNRRRIADERLLLGDGPGVEKVKVNVCVGTNCFLKGSQAVLSELLHDTEKKGLQDQVDITASFCFERCAQGPTVEVDGKHIHHCTGARACTAVAKQIEGRTGSSRSADS
jgi:NADH-quinone oxidoreductase subunit G